MIRALEEHLLAWMKNQLNLLEEQSGLFGPVRTSAGELEFASDNSLGSGEIGLLIKVEGLTPLPENRDLGPPPATQWSALHMRSRITLIVMGDNEVLDAVAGREIAPADTHLHRVDLTALTLLSLLRDRPGPAPDLAEPPELDEEQGKQPSGAASAAQGTRKAQLYWTAIEPGEAQVEFSQGGHVRQWTIPLSANCTFRLSPASLDGGRILQIGRKMEINSKYNRYMEAAVYASAESIPLGYFAGLNEPVIAELGEYDVTTLGDLETYGASRMDVIAAELRSASEEERLRLSQLTSMAALRRNAAEILMPFQIDPELIALPARALLAPTPAEQTVLMRASGLPGVSERIELLGVPVVALLKPECRENVSFGTVLTARR